MPDGLLQWYDAGSGEGRIVRGGREYPVHAGEMEPHARVPGARVHFDVDRREGVEVATNVALRSGTRVSRRQRRFGEMVGARRPDTRGTAPFAQPHPEVGHELATSPTDVARAWADSLGGNDVDAAALLYAPDAVVHAGDEDLRGRRIATWLSASRLPGDVHADEVTGAGDTIEVGWTGPDRRRATTWMRIEHGEIVEQWLAGARPPRDVTGPPAAPPEPGVEVVARGAGAEAMRDTAEEKLRRVMGLVDDPVLYARVKLADAPDPAVSRPASAKATLDINGQIVRAHVSAGTMPEAVERLEARLRDRLQHRSERERALRRVERVEPGEWRHGQLPTERPDWFDRPPEEREVVRRKTFTLDEVTVDEAAFDMEMLDHDFHLFRDLATGDDALLRRSPDGGGAYTLQRLGSSELDAGAAVVDVAVDTTPPPTMWLEEALDWLAATGERHVFFRDRGTGRGHVAYQRYDGHYGLITPGDEPAAAGAGPVGGESAG